MSKSEKRQKTELLQIRATPSEKELLKERAAAFGISVGELVRRTLFGTKPKSNTDQQAIAALAMARADLGRLGGLLKGWLGNSFPGSPTPNRLMVDGLISEIEIAKMAVLAAAEKLVEKI